VSGPTQSSLRVTVAEKGQEIKIHSPAQTIGRSRSAKWLAEKKHESYGKSHI